MSMTQRRNPEEAPSTLESLPDSPRIMAGGDRDEGRVSDREFVRGRPVEPHEKYEIPSERMKRGMSYVWAALRVPYSTLRSRRLNDFRAGGFQYARAADYPELSGYKPATEVNRRFVDLGLEDEVRADDPVMLDGSVLMERPAELTKQAERERDVRAHRQLADHLQQRLESSERAIGANRTQMSQNYGSAPEEAPSDAAAEY